MPSIVSLLPKLKADYPDLSLIAGERFAWSPSDRTVLYDASEPDNISLLLHELSHGLLGHHRYSKDIELVSLEASAWEKARELAELYELTLDETSAETHLDTYRDWMHARSTCPRCEATGYQSGTNEYTCVACSHQWRVNEARLCGLKRYSL